MNPDQWIFDVVHSFYDKAKTDILIGYHFRNIQNFDEHIPRISAFWELQLLGKTHRSLSEPFDLIRAHQPLGIKRGELGRWLLLLRMTIDEQLKLHPEMEGIKIDWEKKLRVFENIFLRAFGL